MSVFCYERYKIRIAPDSAKTQGLQPGDIVRRAYKGRNEDIYTLMAVTECGTDVIDGKDSPYFIGALLEGDVPRNGELLDFVRLTSLLNPERSGALYLTASDSEAPYLDVVDGMATEQSLCYPVMAGGTKDVPDKNRYACSGSPYISMDYTASEGEIARICRICRNDTILETGGQYGLKQPLEEPTGHPERLLFSFRTRSSKPLSGIAMQFGHTNGEKADAKDVLDTGIVWEYHLWVITVEYPRHYKRSFSIDLTKHLTSTGEWFEISDLNIVRLSSVVSLAGSTKSRIGKVSGISDPVYGVLEGYGAYFQRLYATKDVNIAGTLTAGDQNGFSSTFYVGKIHKNVIINSLECNFSGSREINCVNPVGIGKVVCLEGDSSLKVQTPEWREAHTGQQYCFSIWTKVTEACQVAIYQDEHFLQNIEITAYGEWQRHKVVFFIHGSASQYLQIRLTSDAPELYVTAPQLESGNKTSPYQATDDVLSYTEDYGAWLCKGGIGGTIQNPLLRLNEDGSIRSRDGSFVIKQDGTGHFAGGRFKWTSDRIELQDVSIRWEDLSEVIPEHLKPYYVSVTGSNVFYNRDATKDVYEPSEIVISGREYNFEGSSRYWEYLSSDGQWKATNCQGHDFILTPFFAGWEGRDVLSIRYTAIYGGKEYSGNHTIYKQYAGGNSYSIYITSDQGTVFKNGIVSTILRAYVYENGIEIDSIPESCFLWKRTSTDQEADVLWNSSEHRGRILEITENDVCSRTVFDCEVTISNPS